MSVVEVSSGTLSSTATPNRTLQGPTKAGHAILVLITSYLGSGSTITHNSCQDDQGGSTSDYTLLEAQDTPGGSDNYKHTVFLRENLTGASGTTTVTVNASATSNHSMTVLHLDRVPASGVVLDSAAATGSSNAPSVTLAATSVATALIVGSMTHNNGSPTITANATNQPILYAVWTDNGSTEANAVSGRRVDATGTYTANWSLGASSTWSAFAIAIAQEGGPAEVGWEGHGVGAQTATSGATLSPTLPAGLLENDVLILWAARSDNTAGTTPTDWTNIAALTGNTTAAHRVEAYWRRVPSGGVTAPTFTFGTGTVVRGARITAYSGCATASDPFDTGTGAPTKTNDTGTDATIEFTDLTTTALGCLVLALWAYEDDPTASSVISNYLQPTASHQQTSLGTDMAIGYQFRQMGAAGAAGLNTITVSGGSFSGPKVGAGLALIPEVSGTTFPVAIGGTLGLVGAIVRQDNKVLAGTLGSAGALAKQGRRALAGTLGMAGALAKRNNKPLAATLGLAGAEADAKLTLLALAGTLGAAGALVKQGRRVVAGTLGAAGTLAKQTNRALAATLGMTGALARQNRIALAAALGAAGALTITKVKLLALAGTLGSVGVLVKQNRLALAGTLSAAGTLVKQGRRALAGVLGMSGAQQGAYAAEVLGTTGLCAYWPLEETSGGVCNSLLGSYPATASVALDPTTAVVAGGGPAQHFDGTQGLTTGAMGEVWRTKSAISIEGWVRLPPAVISGHHAALAAIRNDSNEDFYILLLQGQSELEVRLRVNTGTGGDLTPVISLDGGVHHFVSAYDSTTGVHDFYWDKVLLETGSGRSGMPDRGTDAGAFRIGVDPNANHWEGDLGHIALYDVALSAATVEAHYDAGAVVGALVPVAVSGVLGAAGELVKQGQRTLVGTLALSGTLAKQGRMALAGTLGLAGAVVKQGRRALAGTLGSTGAVAAAKLKLVALAGTLGMTGALAKQSQKVLAGTLSAAGALVKQNRRAVAGTLGAVGSLVKRTSRAVAGVLGATGAVDTAGDVVPVALAGTLGAAGAIRRQVGKTLTGTLGAAGTLVKRINRGLAGVLAALGALVTEPRRRVGGAVGMTGAVATTKTRTAALTGTLGSTGSLTTTLTRGPEVGGALGFGGGDVAIVLILTPPPPPVEFGLPAETGIGQATLVGETPYVEFAPFGPLTVTEAGLIMADVPPETGGASESPPPEFRLRG